MSASSNGAVMSYVGVLAMLSQGFLVHAQPSPDLVSSRLILVSPQLASPSH